MSDPVKKRLRAALTLLSMIALAAIVYIGWGQLSAAASLHRHWNFVWLAAAIAAQLVVYVCITTMFMVSLKSQAHKLTAIYLFYCAFAFLFANRALPGPALVGVGTLIYLMRAKSVPSVDAQTAAGAFYFADYAGFFALVIAVAAPFIAHVHSWPIFAAFIVSLAIVLLAALLVVAAFCQPKPVINLISKIMKLVQRQITGRDESSWAESTELMLLQLRSQLLKVAADPIQLFSFFALSIVMHVFEVFTITLGAYAAGIKIAFTTAAAGYAAGNLASIISVLPGGLGFYEAGMIGTIHLVGSVRIGDAAVCALTYRTLSLWAPLPVVAGLLLKVVREGISETIGKPQETM